MDILSAHWTRARAAMHDLPAFLIPPRLGRRSPGPPDPDSCESSVSLAARAEDLIITRAPRLLESSGTPGVVFVVRIDGCLHVARCFGFADLQQPRPMSLSTVFRVGSMSKPVTALGVLRLVDRGLVRLDDPVFRHIHSYELPLHRRGGFDLNLVTIRRVLSHTSGLNVHSHPWWAPGADLPTVPQLLDGIDGPACELRIEHQPGTITSYSGGGILLLGLLIEEVAGLPFSTFMDQEILGPLGMHQSTYEESRGLASDLATAYTPAGEPMPSYSLGAAAASGLYTTPMDMTRFWTSLMPGANGEPPGRGLISPALVAEALSDQRHGAEGDTWGLGFLLYLFPEGVAYRHGGQRPGWFCHAEADAHARFCILAMSNSDHGAEVINPVVADLRRLLAEARRKQVRPGAVAEPARGLPRIPSRDLRLSSHAPPAAGHRLGEVSRRHFLVSGGAVALGFAGLHRLMASPMGVRDGGGIRSDLGYGPLLPDPARVLDLPRGFSYRIVRRTGEEMDDGLLAPGLPDGMATFAAASGLTILICNHELTSDHGRIGPFGSRNERLARLDPALVYDRGWGRTPAQGGTTTMLYDTRTGRLERHFLSLAGTVRNCAGGPTPWGTWLTCEEDVTRARPLADAAAGGYQQDHGYVFEVPATEEPALATPAPIRGMGRFYHEAVAVDPRTGIVYLTEDRHDGLLYRYIPAEPGNMHAGGRLQALAIRGRASLDTRNWGWGSSRAVRPGEPLEVQWIDLEEIEAPRDDLRDRGFAAGAARFARGEGMWWGHDSAYFCCTNGGRARRGQIWRLVPPALGDGLEHLELFVEPNDASIMNMADNMTVAPWGDLILCEDGDRSNRLLGVTPAGEIYQLARNAGSQAEFAGSVFSPDGSTLFVNAQQDGVTFAITGPWRSS